MKTNWQKRFMDLARHIATWSKDNSTKVGCVIVDSENTIKSQGYNGQPRNSNDEIGEHNKRPMKYMYVVHAELNAILNATRNGICLKDTIMYVTYFPCNECAKAIINSGIKTLVTYEPNFSDERWADSFKISYEMLIECGVNIIYFSDEYDEFYNRFIDALCEQTKKDDYKTIEWDYKITRNSTDFTSRRDWNQTLMTKINQCSAIIFKANNRCGANKVRVTPHLFKIVSTLEFFNNETMILAGRYDVIIDYKLPKDEIVVYYDGCKGYFIPSEDEKKNGFVEPNKYDCYKLINVLNYD
jgi:dCMP deaminase